MVFRVRGRARGYEYEVPRRPVNIYMSAIVYLQSTRAEYSFCAFLVLFWH